MIVSAVATLVLLAGCSDVSDKGSLVTTPAQAFASRSAAESAARAAYLRYLEMSNEVSKAGGTNVERLAPLVTPKELAEERTGAQYLVDNGLRVSGKSELTNFRLQEADLKSGDLSAYVCVDLADARVLDRRGRDITPDDRVDQQTSLATFVWRDSRLMLDENSTWSGQSVC